MTLIRGYLARAIILASALVLLVLLALTAFVEFVGQLDNIGVGEYTLSRAVAYALLRLPDTGFTVLPISVFLGALLGLGALAQYSELIAIRAAGVSMAALVRSVLVSGIVLALFAAALGEYLSPPLQRYARQLRFLSMQGSGAASPPQSAWMRDGNLIVNINSPGDPARTGVDLFQVESGTRLVSITHADSVGFDAAKRWVLSNLKETQFGVAGVVHRAARQRVQTSSLSPSLLGLAVVRPETLDGLALYRYVLYLRGNGLDARHYEVAFWSRLGAVAVIPVMCVLALCFAFGQLRRAGAGARTLVGIGVGLAYYLCSEGLSQGGEVFALNPVLVAFLPCAVLALITAIALARAR